MSNHRVSRANPLCQGEKSKTSTYQFEILSQDVIGIEIGFL